MEVVSLSDESVVETEGMKVTKSFDAEGFPVPAVTFRVESDRNDPVGLRITDEIPEGFGIEQIGFHPDYGSEHWTATGEGVVRFERTVNPGEAFTTVYGIRMADDEEPTPFLEAPSVEVDPSAIEEEEIDEVVPKESSEVVRELASGERDTVPGLEEEEEAPAAEAAEAEGVEAEGPADPLDDAEILGEPGTEPPEEAEEEPAVEADAEPSFEAKSASEIGAEAEAEAESEEEPEIDLEEEPGLEAKSASEIGAEAEEEAGVEEESEFDLEEEPDIGAEEELEEELEEAEAEEEPEIDLEEEPEIEPEAELEKELEEAEAEEEPVIDLEDEPEIGEEEEPDVGAEAELEEEPGLEAEEEPEIDLEAEPGVETEAEPAVEGEEEPEIEAVAEPEAEAEEAHRFIRAYQANPPWRQRLIERTAARMANKSPRVERLMALVQKGQLSDDDFLRLAGR